MMYILTVVVDAIIHGWFSFVHTCVLMGYQILLSGLAKRILFVISFSLQVQQI